MNLRLTATGTIRQRAAQCLDSLPRNATFDWVDRVSIKLTTQMLATLFDFPWEDRRKLTRWSDVATALPGNTDIIASEEARQTELMEFDPRTHLSFSFGIHRCVGIRLAELQLKIVWEEILKRFDNIEVVEQPHRVYSSFVKGYETLPVRLAS